MKDICISSDEALERLKAGNKVYINTETSKGDVSRSIREFTHTNGQKPYAIIIACSDSRVIPEAIFNAGIGELFVIRVAGNVIDNNQLGSIEYAVGHLGCPLIVVLGHDCCGAVDAAINHKPEGYVRYITDEIQKAVGKETDDFKACCLNIKHSVKKIESSLDIQSLERSRRLKVCGAVYRTFGGEVEFLDE